LNTILFVLMIAIALTKLNASSAPSRQKSTGMRVLPEIERERESLSSQKLTGQQIITSDVRPAGGGRMVPSRATSSRTRFRDVSLVLA
jgi:hypothetical protein